jgi:hypothetical protein
MKTKEAINILNYAVEYYDMMYDSGDKRHNEEEKNNVWKALNHVVKQLKEDDEVETQIKEQDQEKANHEADTINKGE